MTDRTLGVVPARGGSKRVSKKNLRELGGKPLIAHTIEQARAADSLDKTVVSTDDDRIAAVARKHGGRVPFERPGHLATDTASSMAVVEHALNWHAERGEQFDWVVLLQVTSPFRTATDVDGALNLLSDTGADSVISVSEFETPPVWAVTRNEDARLSPYGERGYLWADDVARSQDVPTLYHPNGAVFGATVKAFQKTGGFYTPDTVGFVMPAERSLDIDNPHELELARAWYEYRRQK